MSTSSRRHLLVALLSGLGALAAIVVASPSRATSASPNGLLAYQSMVGGHTQLFTIKPDGTDAHQITHWTDSDAINAAWSPDGMHIAYVRHWLKPRERERLYTVNADSTGSRELNRKLVGFAIWAADGRHLLTMRALRLVLVKADGTSAKDAGIPGLPSDTPCFLGHSNRVAELVSRSDGESAIFIGRIGGGRRSLKRITPWQGINHIACSPVSSEIAFNTPNYETSPQSSNVYTINSAGLRLRKVTHSVGGKIDNIPDSWSPDGRKLAFISNKTGTFEIYSMNSDGTAVMQITRGPEAHLASWGSHP